MGGSRIIMVVDDDADIRESFQELLELEGYRVITAGDGQDGLEVLGTPPPPSVVLLDYMMPVMNGAEFLVRLRAEKQLADIPVVMVTAFADRAEHLPADAFMEKPVKPERLLEVLRGFLARSE